MKESYEKNAPTISMEYINILLNFTEVLGANSDLFLKGTNIKKGEAYDPMSYINYSQALCLLQNIWELTQDRGIGIEAGSYLQPLVHGFVGYAAVSSATLADAIQVMIKYAKIRSRDLQAHLLIVEDRAIIRVETRITPPHLRKMVLDLMLSGTYHNLQALLGKLMEEVEVHFSYEAAAPLPLYYKKLKADLRFGCEFNQILFPARYLSQALSTHNPTIAEAALSRCNRILESIKHEENLSSKIRQLLLQTPELFPSQEEIAGMLNITPRTLRRKLRLEGTSYRELLDEIRKDFAISYIKTSHWSIEEISYLLGFQEPASFSHAFKRWTGTSPGTFRNEDLKG
ncbi:MAG: AraC family transcriptional regulator [SAR324 cluster bacterium]|nr:AraC family transcriptional regulator [SAR324 cluster bacterium]